MISLLAKKTLLRVITFYAYGLFVAWIFTLIEKRDEPSYERREKMLETLERELHLRYNMTDKDFNNFVKRTENAVKAGDELDWTFLNSAGFVFAALTTIGKTEKIKWWIHFVSSVVYLKVPITSRLA